jgi:hypothetical protein
MTKIVGRCGIKPTKEEKYKKALEEIREETKDSFLLGYIFDIADEALKEDKDGEDTTKSTQE